MTFARAILAAVLLVLVACGDDDPPPTFRVNFVAMADDARLAGVEIRVAGRAIGRTNPNGELQVNLLGREGASVPYHIVCPTGYREVTDTFHLTLRTFGERAAGNPGRGVEVTVRCLPALREAAVVVRTGGRAGLPVLIQGQEVTRTDSGGVAHFLMRMVPNSTFRVALDTSSLPRLVPANPSESFTLADADDVFVLDQRFTETPPPRRHRPPRPPPGPRGPVRIP